MSDQVLSNWLMHGGPSLSNYVMVGMGRGSSPKFPIGNFPENSERKFRYLSGIIQFFYYYINLYILEVCLIRPELAGNAGYFMLLEI